MADYQTLQEVADAVAFLVADLDYPDTVAGVSSDYITLYTRVSPLRGYYGLTPADAWQVQECCQHGLGNNYEGGLYGADAAKLHDAARLALRRWALYGYMGLFPPGQPIALDDDRYCPVCGADVVGNDPHGEACPVAA